MALFLVLLVTACAPKTCGHSSICKCHDKTKKNKKGMDAITARQAFPEPANKSTGKWKKKPSGSFKQDKRKKREKF